MQPNPVSLRPDQTIQEAIGRMNELRIGAVLVCDNSRLVGIFTERDFLRNAAIAEPGWRLYPIEMWMTKDPHTIAPNIGWEEAAFQMERMRVRHLPVVEDGLAIGIISSRHLIAHRSKYLDQMIARRTSELRLANDQLLSRDAEMTHYMKVAAKLQKKLVLPHSPPNWPEFDWSIYFAPLEPLGGDYYDFVMPNDEHLGFLIADASGHSIPAAMVAIMASQAFTEVSKETVQPSSVLAALNKRLNDLAEDRFVTGFYGVFNRRTREFTYANAGHPFPFHYSAKRKMTQPLWARGFLLGVSLDEMYTEKRLHLEAGDRLCFFTDGIPDCRNDQGESFGTDRLAAFITENAHRRPADFVEVFRNHLKVFRENQNPTDDMTLITLEVH
ncbi:SpoIIE family protein phosphatase [Telmatocola sphagniphila]|uniref:SpoIIE family protein phosphatase n=2 Tax=Telmatocola sphagniphila TaxID=1123043 RepID=A0A8E6BB84_9BACT|nr:SpoIIE family protein phosphatase [Telmatocola sphagniphila]